MPSIILDSGAFSAWIKQETIDIVGYTEYCLQVLPHIDYVVNLDVIPGKFGMKSIHPELRNKAAQEGWDNYLYMLDAGIPKDMLIHVFHQGDDIKWLERMLAHGMKYIGISPANDCSTNERILWLDSIMPWLTDENGYPTVKFHGFAATSLRLIWRYPWFSVDSTSWVLFSRYGTVYVPYATANGEYIYNRNPWMVFTSNRSKKLYREGQRHIDTFPGAVRKRILNYFESKGFSMGISDIIEVEEGYKPKENESWFDKESRKLEIIIEPGLANHYYQRDLINIQYHIDLMNAIPPWPTKAWERKRGIRG